jgi:hypothetical protein
MSDPKDQFAEMLAEGERQRQEESDRMLAELIRAWPYLSEETRGWVVNRLKRDLAEKEALRGPAWRRAWNWLKAWWYQLPIYWARKR